MSFAGPEVPRESRPSFTVCSQNGGAKLGGDFRTFIGRAVVYDNALVFNIYGLPQVFQALTQVAGCVVDRYDYGNAAHPVKSSFFACSEARLLPSLRFIINNYWD